MTFISGQKPVRDAPRGRRGVPGEPQKEWHELTFAEQSEWQASADQVNETDKEDSA